MEDALNDYKTSYSQIFKLGSIGTDSKSLYQTSFNSKLKWNILNKTLQRIRSDKTLYSEKSLQNLSSEFNQQSDWSKCYADQLRFTSTLLMDFLYNASTLMHLRSKEAEILKSEEETKNFVALLNSYEDYEKQSLDTFLFHLQERTLLVKVIVFWKFEILFILENLQFKVFFYFINYLPRCYLLLRLFL